MSDLPNQNGNNTYDLLDTLKPSGKPPETRIGDGNQAYQIWQRLWGADSDRSWRRTLVKGLVDGNPPYNPSDLTAAGQAYRCNVNWGDAKSYLSNASGAYYDLFNEAPSYCTVKINKGSLEERQRYSRIVTEHFDWLLKQEKRFDYNMQVSQDEMTLYAIGPLVFNDEFDWCPRAILAGSVKVPEFTKSDTTYWELCTVEVEYSADELWRKIIDEKAARAAGWNVEAVKQAIMNSSPYFNQGNLYRQWEWHQTQLKNGSLIVGQTSKVIMVVQIFFQEFTKDGESQGRISQVIVNRDQAAQKGGGVFLYQKVGRYENWDECVHPMYYDRGGGGYHHSVTGLGVKMYPALTFINRLRCATADKAFAPKIAFRAPTATSADEASIMMNGDHMILPEGWEAVQMPTGSYLEDGIVFDKFTAQNLNNTLSQYRQQTIREDGNPPSATQVKFDASNEARLQKTNMTRYYAQLDSLELQMYKRAIYQGKKKIGFGWKKCEEFVRRCVEAGVPAECLDHVESVRATRVIGQGSEFMRRQSLEFLFTVVYPTLDEQGKFNLRQDLIAAMAGQDAVERYSPDDKNLLPDNQIAWAMSQVAGMKVGVPAVPTKEQNPAIAAGVFIDSATQAIQSLEQGGNPAEVAAFLELCGRAIATQIDRMSGDPTRKDLVKAITKKLKEIGQVADKLQQQLAEEQQFAQEEQMRMQQAAMDQQSDQALKWRKLESDTQIKQAKAQAQMREKSRKQRFDMSLADAKSAQDISLTEQEAQAKMEADRMKAQAAANKPKAKN